MHHCLSKVQMPSIIGCLVPLPLDVEFRLSRCKHEFLSRFASNGRSEMFSETILSKARALWINPGLSICGRSDYSAKGAFSMRSVKVRAV
jgi:hypothetical protein